MQYGRGREGAERSGALPGGLLVRRWFAATLGLLLLTACSKDDDGSPRSASPASASASAPAPPAASPLPGASPASPSAAPPPPAARAPRPSPSATRSPTITLPSSPAVRLRAEPEVVRQPAPGDYVYDLTGSGGGPPGAEQPYPPGAVQTYRVSPGAADGGGTVYETVQTQAQEPSVRTTVRTRWEPGRVRLLSTAIQVAGQGFSCTYSPPPEILHIPPAAETFPRQSFSGACSGTVDVSVTGPETVTAVGRAWRTWKVRTTSRFTAAGGLTGTVDATAWLAPELGQPVKTATILDARAGAMRLSANQTAVLRSHP